jgi:hypothetical protein
MRDGRVLSDLPVKNRVIASQELAKLEQATRQEHEEQDSERQALADVGIKP